MSHTRVVASPGEKVIGQRVMPWSEDTRRWLYVAALLCLISLLALLYLTQAGYVARQIEEMDLVQREMQDVKESNNALLLEIAQYEDMSRIQQQARAQGLGPATQVEYAEVFVDESLSGLSDTAAVNGSDVERGSLPSASSGQPGRPAQRSWWQSVFDQFDAWIQGGFAARPRL